MFYDRFVKLCNEKGVSPSAAAEQIGLTRSANTKWAEGKIPRKATLVKLADYFGVPPEYFWAETPAEIKASPAPRAEVEDIIKIYDMLTPERQKQLRAAIADLLKDQLQE